MKKKKIILIVIAVFFVLSGIYGSHEFFRRNPDMTDMKTNFKTDATVFLKEFDANDSIATEKYLGKIIEVNGRIKKIEKDDRDYFTVVLSDNGNISSVRCAMDTSRNSSVAVLHAGNDVVLKGMFTGFNKDATGLLGSDAQVNRCIIIPGSQK